MSTRTQRDPFKSVVVFLVALLVIAVSFRLVCDGLAEFTQNHHTTPAPTISVVVPNTTNDLIVPERPKPTLTVEA